MCYFCGLGHTRWCLVWCDREIDALVRLTTKHVSTRGRVPIAPTTRDGGVNVAKLTRRQLLDHSVTRD